jgi:hypothetical protein
LLFTPVYFIFDFQRKKKLMKFCNLIAAGRRNAVPYRDCSVVSVGVAVSATRSFHTRDRVADNIRPCIFLFRGRRNAALTELRFVMI